MSGGALNASGVEDDVAAYPSFLDYKKSIANFFTKLIVFFINLETAKVKYLLIYTVLLLQIYIGNCVQYKYNRTYKSPECYRVFCLFKTI